MAPKCWQKGRSTIDCFFIVHIVSKISKLSNYTFHKADVFSSKLSPFISMLPDACSANIKINLDKLDSGPNEVQML